MADYGLISKNNNGDVQIDSTFQNFIMQKSGSVYPNPASQGMTSITISSSPTPPLVAIKPSSDYFVSMVGYGLSEGQYNSIKIVAGDHPPEDFTSFSSSVSYIVGRLASSSTESYGLVVNNADGKTCFHSAYRYLKILSAHSFTLANPNPATGNFPYRDIYHPGIYNPYYILTPNWSGFATAGYESPPPNPIFHIQAMSVGFKRLSSEYARVRSFVFGSFPNINVPISSTYWSGAFTLLTCSL